MCKPFDTSSRPLYSTRIRHPQRPKGERYTRRTFMKKRLFQLYIGSMFWLIGCQEPTSFHKETTHPQGFRIPTSRFSKLFFTATDMRYTSSALYWMDFRTGHVEQALGGESGDPWLLWSLDRLLVANRSPLNNNAFFLDRTTKQPLSQQATPKLNIQSGVTLCNGDLLVNDGNSAMLVQLHSKTLEVVARYTAPARLIDQAELGSDVLRVQIEGIFYILALTHGLENGYRANNAQTLSIWEEDPFARLTWRNSLPLSMSSPRFLHPTAKGVGIIGLCSSLLAKNGCQAGRSWFSFADQALSATQRFPSQFWHSYGAIIGGATPYEAFALVTAAAQPNTRRLVHLSWEPGSALTTVGEISVPLSTQGSPLLLLDTTSQTLFVGNASENGGTLTLLHSQTKKVLHRMELERIPYNGALAL